MQTQNLLITLPTELLASLAPSLPDLIDDTIDEVSEVCVGEVTEESIEQLIKLASEKVQIKAIPKQMRKINIHYIFEQLKAAPYHHVEGDDDYV